MIMSKDVVLHGSKVDWIITEKLEKLREIMDEDATFINLPPIGTDQNRISGSGTTLPLIERSIRRMNKLVSPTPCRSILTFRSPIIFNSPMLFFRTPTQFSNHPGLCQRW